MDQATIQRYQSGGDIYASLLKSYGQATADACAQAALSGDRTQITAALSNGMFGAPLDTSTLDAFTTQLETNPFGAPIDDFNSLLGKTFADVLKNPAVLILAIIVGVLAVVLLIQWIRKSL
jgi:hypothetical protein